MVKQPNVGQLQGAAVSYKHTHFEPAKALSALYGQLGRWRDVADVLGAYSPAYWCMVVKDGWKLSEQAQDVLRWYYGLAPVHAHGRIARMKVTVLARYIRERFEYQPWRSAATARSDGHKSYEEGERQ